MFSTAERRGPYTSDMSRRSAVFLLFLALACAHNPQRPEPFDQPDAAEEFYAMKRTAPAGSDPHALEAVIKAKLARQAVFHRSREFIFYIHEHALRLPVGGEEVMKAQLLHLLMMTVRPYLVVRVVPIAVGAHAGVAGSFTRLKYEKFEPVNGFVNRRDS